MSMKGSLQSTVAPVTTPNSVDFNQISTGKQKKAMDMGQAPDDVDFRTMIQNSNADTSRERSAKKTGDLSSAKTDEEFFQALSQRANGGIRTPKNTLGKDDFLTLFIAQMKNQDPLNPDNATEMASQMAQFNSLEQMMNVNNTLGDMVKSQELDRAVQLVNYVGKEVDVSNGLLKFDKNKLTKATYEVDGPTSNARLEVRDSGGQVVAVQDLGSLMPGEHKVKWDGKTKEGGTVNAGIYNFQIVSQSQDGQEFTIPIRSRLKITGVDMQDKGGSFHTDLGKIQLTDIAAVGLQEFGAENISDPQAQPAVDSKVDGKQLPNDENKQSAAKKETAPTEVKQDEKPVINPSPESLNEVLKSLQSQQTPPVGTPIEVATNTTP